MKKLALAGIALVVVFSGCDFFLEEEPQFTISNEACFPIEVFHIDRDGTTRLGTIPAKGSISFDTEVRLKHVSFGGTQPTRVIFEAKAVGIKASATKELWVSEQDLDIGILSTVVFYPIDFGSDLAAFCSRQSEAAGN